MEMSSNPVDEVSSIVDQFSSAMDRLGKPNAMRWVEPHVIKNWPGVSKDCVDLSGGAVTPPLLESLGRLKRPSWVSFGTVLSSRL